MQQLFLRENNGKLEDSLIDFYHSSEGQDEQSMFLDSRNDIEVSVVGRNTITNSEPGKALEKLTGLHLYEVLNDLIDDSRNEEDEKEDFVCVTHTFTASGKYGVKRIDYFDFAYALDQFALTLSTSQVLDNDVYRFLEYLLKTLYPGTNPTVTTYLSEITKDEFKQKYAVHQDDQLQSYGESILSSVKDGLKSVASVFSPVLKQGAEGVTAGFAAVGIAKLASDTTGSSSVSYPPAPP